MRLPLHLTCARTVWLSLSLLVTSNTVAADNDAVAEPVQLSAYSGKRLMAMVMTLIKSRPWPVVNFIQVSKL